MRSALAAVAAAVLLCTVSWTPRASAGEDAAARAYLAGDLEGARKLLEAEVKAGDARPSRYLFLGRVYFRLERWPEAQATLEDLIRRDVENPQGRELLGRVLFRRGRFADAIPYYEESLREAPGAELRLEFGEALIGTGRKTEAVVQLTEVTRDARTWPRAHYLLGGLRLESGLGHWAARQLWVAHSLGYRQPDLSVKLARAFHLEGRITGPFEMVGPLAAARAGDRTDKRILVRRAELAGEGFWHAAAPDCALYQVEAALAEPGGVAAPPATLMLAARCWLAAGNLERAGHYASRLGAAGTEGLLLRAEVALAGRDLDAFERLLPAEPGVEMIGPLVRAALLAQVAGDPRRALALLERAEKLSPGRSEVMRPTIDVLARLGRREEAAARARLLAELHPESPEVRLIAGRYGVNFEEIEQGGAPVLEETGERKQ